MCLIALAWKAHPGHRLVVAAHRDEWRDRPAASAHWWPEAPQVAGGRDLQAGGAWLGATRTGRFAAVTNFRDPAQRHASARSRGALVSGFLLGSADPLAYLQSVAAQAQAYQGFNLVVSDGETLAYFSNRGEAPRALEPGVHALSNHLLNTPWPKVDRARRGLAEQLHADDASLFGMLADPSPAPDEFLPDTGVGLERERALSAMLITGERYGTRSATVVRVGGSGGSLCERTLDASGAVVSTVTLAWP